MITEDYVSVETAKLLKKKGFDWEVHRSYLINHNVFIPGDINDVPLRKDVIRIPTLQMAMKWLREVHKMYVCISYTEENNWAVEIQSYNGENYSVSKSTQLLGLNLEVGFDSYEEACETAIKYCLENLI